MRAVPQGVMPWRETGRRRGLPTPAPMGQPDSRKVVAA